jgi:tyrosyl-tRNA synthetase
VNVTGICTDHSQVFASKGELRRLVQGGGLSINKVRIDNPEMIITADLLLNNKYLLIQKGKKNYYLLRIV